MRVLFVCLGNICRSPTAEGVFRAMVAEAGLEGEVVVDSAGTAGWHVGEPPDRRAQAEARARGLDISGLRGRQLGVHDFEQFDLLLVMDRDNERDVLRLAPDDEARAKVRLLRSFDPDAVARGDLDVPDPYYGGPDGFAAVYDAIERLPGAARCDPQRVRTFTKRRPGAPPGFFEAEARGLRWLAEVGAPVPEVVSVGPEHIEVAWIDQGRWTPEAEAAAGRAVAAMHAAGAPCFGLADGAGGFIGPLPMTNEPADDWPTFYGEQRVLPFLRAAVDAGSVAPSGAAVIESVCARLSSLAGPPEPPARIHGDLWSGNLLCDTSGRPWLVDPAAHGGHRETDLAMLALFGGLSARFVAAYEEVHPLAGGWRDRQALHQLHPLLVHAVLFGGSYGPAAVDAAARYR